MAEISFFIIFDPLTIVFSEINKVAVVVVVVVVVVVDQNLVEYMMSSPR